MVQSKEEKVKCRGEDAQLQSAQRGSSISTVAGLPYFRQATANNSKELHATAERTATLLAVEAACRCARPELFSL